MAFKQKNVRSLVKLGRKQTVPVKVDKNLIRRAAEKLDTPQLRRAAAVAAGVAVVAAAGSTTARYQFHRNIVSKELKKQLAPLHEEIAQLQQSVDALQKELEAERERK